MDEESCSKADSHKNPLPNSESEKGHCNLDEVKTVHTKKKEYMITLQNLSVWEQNLKNVHLKESENIKCNYCSSTFTSIEYLWKHVYASHKDVKEVPCPVCGEVFYNMKSLYNHKHKKHVDVYPVQCTKCKKTYKGKRNLRLHMKTVHAVEDDVTCPHCDKVFKTKLYLNMHLNKLLKKQAVEYKCPCETIFTSHIDYKCHMAVVHPDKRIWCMLCHEVLKIAEARKHVTDFHQIQDNVDKYLTYKDISMQPKPEFLTCGICLKKYFDKTSYERHLSVAHPPKEAEVSCNICQKIFKSHFHLMTHKRDVHSGIDFRCNECNKAFASKRYLKRHKMSHISQIVVCDMCGNWYSSRPNLLRHIRKVHKKSI